MQSKCYSELKELKTFLERFEYLKLDGTVGADTFGYDRWVNQAFYRSAEWKAIRNRVITRDLGCDLGVEGYDIHSRVLVHHMNPISLKDIENQSSILLNPEYLITTCHATHNAIHYGDESLLAKDPIIRVPNDTCPWRK